MSDPPKSTPTFAFGKTSTSGSSSLFGSASTNTNNSGGGLFGKGAAIPTTSASSLFGLNHTPPGTSTGSILGGAPGTSAPSVPSNLPAFGGGVNAGPSKSVFGGQGPGGSNSFGGGQTSNITPFSGLSTPSKPSDPSNSGPSQTASFFGKGVSTGGGNVFGNLGGISSPPGQAGSTTPASSKSNGGFNLGIVSTTPAGPPPSGGTGQAGNSGLGFNLNKPQEQNNSVFGASSAQSNTQTSTSSTTRPNPFASALVGGGSNPFGDSKALHSPATSSTTQNKPSLFGANLTTSAPNPFGGTHAASGSGPFRGLKPAVSSGPSLSSNQDKTQSASQTSHGGAPNSSSAFPSLGNQKPLSETPVTQSSVFGVVNKDSLSSTGINSPFTFPSASTTQPSTTPAITTASTSGSLTPFGNLGGQTVTSPTSAGSSLPQTQSVFSSFKPVEPVATSSSSAAPASTAAPTTSMFGGAASKTTAQPASRPVAATSDDDASKTTTNLGTSTTGPRPPAQSRLKNKSMDEIITRWASDLSKYQKEFQRQALKVAEWDRMLVENSDKIQKLYGSTLEAERATIEVERQLSAVENDQTELEYWLAHYEKQVDELMSTQVGQGDTLQGPDQERERTYKLAERLTDRLGEMAKDLTSMIGSINDASSTLSKNNKSDDPLSQIVRVLNGHLSQLQKIDQGTAALQAKVAAAQKASRNMAPYNGMGGLRGDAADEFYRSYMGRRQ